MAGSGSVSLEGQVRETLHLTGLHMHRVPEERKIDGGGSKEGDQHAAQREMVEDEAVEHRNFRFWIFDFRFSICQTVGLRPRYDYRSRSTDSGGLGRDGLGFAEFLEVGDQGDDL